MEASERAYRPGTFYRYSLASDQSVTVRAEPPDANLPPPMRFRIKGEWRVGVCTAGAETVDARITFSPAVVTLEANGAPLAAEVQREVREGLSTPFFVTLDKAGGVRWIHFEHRANALTQGLLRSVVAMSQVVLPPTKRGSWEASEEDSAGRYLADYRIETPLHVDKHKRRYTHVALDDGVQPVGDDFKMDVTAQSTLTLAREDLWLESLRGHELVTMTPGSEAPLPSGYTLVELRLLERGTDPSLEGALDVRRPALTSEAMTSPRLVDPDDEKQQHRQALAGRTLSDFVQALRTLPEEKKAREKTLDQALTGLRALFRVEPAAAAEVPGVLRAGPNMDTVATILDALSIAATKEALQALSRILDDNQLAAEVRASAVDAVVRSEAPTEASIASLWKLARGPDARLRSTAILALGGAAMYLQERDARAAGALVDKLGEGLRAARGQEAQEVWLGGLGNSRSPRALPALKPFLAVSSASLRAAATQSLRLMPAPEADELLSKRLLSDDSARVRSAVALAAGDRALDPLLPAIERALQTDREVGVRKELVRLLGAQNRPSAEVRRLLAWSSEKDPDASVREDAAKALARSAPR